MLWLVIAGSITIVVFLIALVVNKNSDYRWTETWMATGMCAFFSLLILGVFGQIWGRGMADHPAERYTTLINLADGAGVQGSFFLGSGTIDTTPVYMYYAQDSKGRYRLYHVNASQSYVTYTDDTPTLVIHGNEMNDKWYSFDTGFSVSDYDDDVYEFRVPRGSIKQNFNLDAQ